MGMLPAGADSIPFCIPENRLPRLLRHFFQPLTDGAVIYGKKGKGDTSAVMIIGEK